MKLQSLYKVLSLGVLAIGFASCEKDFMNSRIDEKETEETMNSDYSTLFSLANAPYTFLRNQFTIMDNNIFAPVTDDAVQTAGSSNVNLFNNGSWNAVNNPDNYYTSYYSGIRAANYFLENSGDYRSFLALNRDTFSSSGKADYANDVLNIAWYRGEAHVLRAWYYFELAKRYGGVPLLTSTLSIDDNTDLPRASYDEIIDFVVSEIDTYKDSLQVNWKTSDFSNYDGRINLGMALALKARALLFAASPLHNTSNDVSKWETAASALHDVIEFGQGDGGFALATDYRNYFLQSAPLTSAETIWAIRYTANNTTETNNYPIATPGGNSGVTPSQNLVDEYEYTGTPDPDDPYANRDPRLAYNVVTNGSTWNARTIDESSTGTDAMSNTNASRTGYYLKKFLNDELNLTQSQTVVHNWVVFRYAEILLEYAEAMNEAYGPDADNGYGLTARQAINMVRSRSGVDMPDVVAADQDTFRDAVKHERRVELAFENYRYWDLLRWKDAATALSAPIKGVSVTKDASDNFQYTTITVETRAFDASKMYYYPLPQTEISKSAGVLTQNTGW